MRDLAAVGDDCSDCLGPRMTRQARQASGSLPPAHSPELQPLKLLWDLGRATDKATPETLLVPSDDAP